jgi:hypothetical protein
MAGLVRMSYKHLIKVACSPYTLYPREISNLRFEGASEIISTMPPCLSTSRPLGRWLLPNLGITVQPHWDPIAFEVLIVVQDNALYGGFWPSSHARAIVEYWTKE